jgi:hypothetical protein
LQTVEEGVSPLVSPVCIERGIIMSDSRLNSIHLGILSRRQDYRRARQGLLNARGWLATALELVQGWIPEDADWLALLPAGLPFLPGAKYLLLDRQTADAFPIWSGLNTIGRCPSNDIVLKDVGVSRRHCAILVHLSNECELHDTVSLNGTRVNGRRVRQPVKLVSGDEIAICKRRLFFVGVEKYPGSPRCRSIDCTVPE